MRQIAGNQANPQRDPRDHYPTDPHWTGVLLDHVTLRGPVWECAAGDGDMADVLREAGLDVRATDITQGVDFLETTEPWRGSIVTNPPFRLADRFLLHALELASEQVGMLLPVGYLGGLGRLERIWAPRPPADLIVVSRRMKVHGKSSQFNHLWAVWDLRHPRETRLRWSA